MGPDQMEVFQTRTPAPVDWLFRDVPDPLASLARYFAAQDRGLGRRWTMQRQRRSTILATTRRLMTERDFAQVHVQDVASTCGMSVQTIYNLVGSRAEMIGASAEEWVFAISEAAKQEAAERDVNEIFALLVLLWSSAIVHADYVRSASRSTIADVGMLRQRFHRAGIEVFRTKLAQLRAENHLRATVDVPSLARQLALTANVAISTWAVDGHPVAGFKNDLLNGPGLMLMGALQGEELRRLEQTFGRMRD